MKTAQETARVCLNSEGELEVWEPVDRKKFHYWPAWRVVCDYMELSPGRPGVAVVWFIKGIDERPEFFGREVLSKL